ncbi:MAG TPA: Trm112 family protein [Gemmatimonadaceae bacterium]|nr:Trm112 family protein [Gemmatimonadaceae bacterium]
MRTHEDSWLVARADELVARHIVHGELGCPVCGARYPVRDGVADFTGDARESTEVRIEDVPRSGSADDALALRAAALLALTEPGGIVVLAGEWSAAASEILEMTENVQLLALDYAPGVRSGGALSLARIGDVLPLAAGAARGIALDAAHATPSLLAGAARALAPGGRLIAPASEPLPDSLHELARDARHWVAAAPAASNVSAPVPIGVRR